MDIPLSAGAMSGNKASAGVTASFISHLMTIIGAAAIIATAAHSAASVVSTWSPTATAKTCFYYPGKRSIPGKNELAQILLSSAFWGTDTLYFDNGEENTGVESYPPSDSYTSPDNHSPRAQPRDEIAENSPNTQKISDTPPDGNEKTSIYEYDPTAVPDGELAIIPYDLSGDASPGEVLLSNTTGYSIIPEEYTARSYPLSDSTAVYSASEPLILIVHTHGTEAYSPEGYASVPNSNVHRSSDIADNVVAVGEVMADYLNSAGIPTLHIKIMHDIDSYQKSYDLAADTIQKYLAKYPSIQYVFDIHRDAVYTAEGDLIRPITEINGEPCAQIMFVVGTNEKGADHPNWETNFTVAAHLQSRLTDTYEKFARPINIRGASFNEQFTKGSLLIEIGSAGNSLSEAKNAAKYLAMTIVEIINENNTQKEP